MKCIFFYSFGGWLDYHFLKSVYIRVLVVLSLGWVHLPPACLWCNQRKQRKDNNEATRHSPTIPWSARNMTRREGISIFPSIHGVKVKPLDSERQWGIFWHSLNCFYLMRSIVVVFSMGRINSATPNGWEKLQAQNILQIPLVNCSKFILLVDKYWTIVLQLDRRTNS